MKYIQSNYSIVQLEKDIEEIMTSRKCKKGDIKFIVDTYFNGNVNLAVYILTRLNLLYTDSDAQEFEILRKQYEQKIDEYLKRLEQIENNRAKTKVDVSDNTIGSEMQEAEKKTEKTWELSHEEETSFRKGEKAVLSKHEKGKVSDRGKKEKQSSRN